MKSLNSITIFVLLLVGARGVVCAQTSPSRHDTQNWNDVFLTVSLAKQVDFVMQGTLRNGRNLHRPVDERLGIGFSFKLGKYLTVVPNYLYIGMQPFEGRRVFEDRPRCRPPFECR